MKPARPIITGAAALAFCLLLLTVAFLWRINSAPREAADVMDRALGVLGRVPPFDGMLGGLAHASGTPVMEVRFDERSGRGFALSNRPDGTKFLVNFSLFDGEGADPRGLFIGGSPAKLPASSSGVSYYDGERWHHLWCTANEGIAASGDSKVYETTEWRYVSGQVERKNFKFVWIKSEHQVFITGQPVSITRRAKLGAEDDFVVLEVTVKNEGRLPILYDYAYGDEPWVGRFGDAMGDIGWYEDGVVKHETYLSELAYTYAGFWDLGNEEAGETGEFSNYANFIEWSPVPSMVYFSNDFGSVEPGTPLNDGENRVLNIVWRGQGLEPGESASYTFAIGMAGVDDLTGMPRKPLVAGLR